MGQSTSIKDQPKHEDSRLSETEIKYLQSHLISSENKTLLNLSAFKKNIQGNLSSEIVDRTLAFLQHRCTLSESKFNVEKLFKDISILTYGAADEIADILFEIIHFNKDEIKPTDFEQILILALQSLSFKSKPFNVETTACQRYCNTILEDKKFSEFSKDQFIDFFQKKDMFLKEILQSFFQKMFFGKCAEMSKDILGHVCVLVPSIDSSILRRELTPKDTALSLPDVIYLNSHLPVDVQHKWRLLYSTRLQGESFSRLSSQALNKGPLLIVVKDTGGHTFGGFISTNFVHSSKYQGDEKSFLFTITPKLAVYNTTGYNDHYAYINVGQETMQNGLGMGGQHEYYGLWLSAEFGKGHSKAKPKCTTYGSPQLSSEVEFKIEVLEAWGVGDEPKEESDEEEEGTSVIDRRPDVVAILQIAGKERVSEGYRDEEQSATALPEDHHLHEAHDAMN